MPSARDTRAFDVPAFLSALRKAGCSLGEPFEYHALATSTNDLAKASARAGASAGATILTDEQSAGRGRHGRSWQAPPASALLFSVVLRPQLDPARLSLLTLAAGLGVREAIAATVDAPIGIKWPNDVYSGGRKLAGILVESEMTAGRASAVVLGIGINVGVHEFAADLRGRAATLAELGASVTREALLVSVLVKVEGWLCALEANQTRRVVAELERWDVLLNQPIGVEGEQGVARGIDAEGRLRFEVGDTIRAVASGTISWEPARIDPVSQ